MLTMQVMACMGIIIGLFLLLGINLTDFTGNIFKRLLDGPKGIREEILEQTQRKKKSFLSREVEEIQSILKATDRENTFPFLCTVSLVLFAAGAAGAVMLGNLFLVPVAAVGFMFLPFWYIKLTESHFKKDVSAELEYMVMEPRKEFITMVVLVVGNIPLLYFLNKDWYHTLMHTVVGQIMLSIAGIIIFVSTAHVIRLTKPIEYRS